MGLPGEVTYTRAVRDSSDEISQGKPLNISDNIWLNDPNENQFLSWVLRQGVKESTFNHAFGHLEDAPFPLWVEYIGNATDGANTDEAAQRTDNIYFRHALARLANGHRLYNPRTGEIMRLSADPDATNTTQGVSRNFGAGTATDYMLIGDKLLILSPAHYEGFTMGSGMTNTMVYKSFLTEIVSYPVLVTDTEYAEKARGGNPFIRALNKSWKLSKDQMEATLVFGAKTENNTGTYPLRASEGLINYASTNVYNIGGLINRMDLWDIIGEWTILNKKGGVLVCSKAFKHTVTNWAFQKVQYNQETQKDGLSIQQILTPDGLFDLVECDLFNQHPDLMGTLLMVPNGKIKYRPLVGDIDLDIKYRPVTQEEIHQRMGEIYGEYGWEFFEEETFGVVQGMEF